MNYSDANGNTKTVYYLGDYEYIESNSGTKELHYINGVGGLNAIYEIDNNAGATNGSLYFVAKDYLGSILALFDDNNNIVDENSFDPWGRKRNPNDWSYDMSYKSNMAKPDLTDRGYTGHEHLEDFQLINMNGRMYDPITHQMTSPDILDANPYSTQAYNRYAYVTNNPMKYVDPSGFISDKGPYGAAGDWDPHIDYSYYGQMARFTEYGYLHDEFDEMEAFLNLFTTTTTDGGFGGFNLALLLQIAQPMQQNKKNEIATKYVLMALKEEGKSCEIDGYTYRIDFNKIPFTRYIDGINYYTVLGHEFSLILASEKSSNIVNYVIFDTRNKNATTITFQHLIIKKYNVGVLYFDSHQEAYNFYLKYLFPKP